jgi:hypothetical protein
VLGEVRGRASRDQGNGGEPAGQRTEQVDHAGQWPRLAGIVDDGREGAIEVQAQRQVAARAASSTATFSGSVTTAPG